MLQQSHILLHFWNHTFRLRYVQLMAKLHRSEHNMVFYYHSLVTGIVPLESPIVVLLVAQYCDNRFLGPYYRFVVWIIKECFINCNGYVAVNLTEDNYIWCVGKNGGECDCGLLWGNLIEKLQRSIKSVFSLHSRLVKFALALDRTTFS